MPGCDAWELLDKASIHTTTTEPSTIRNSLPTPFESISVPGQDLTPITDLPGLELSDILDEGNKNPTPRDESSRIPRNPDFGLHRLMWGSEEPETETQTLSAALDQPYDGKMTSHLERRRGGGGRSGGGIAGGGGSSIWVPSLPKPKPAPKPAPQPAPLAAPKSAPHSAPHSTPMPGIRPAPKVGPTLKPKSGSWPIGKPKPKSGPKSGLLPWKKPHMPGHKPHHQWPGHSKPTISALTHSCHAPTGMDRLHCGALDAVLGMIGSFLLIIILATLVGWCIVRRKRKAKRACEEDGMELTSQAVENHRTQTPDTLVNVETPYRSITPTREREGRRHHPYQPSERSSHSFSEIRTATVAKRWGSAVIIDAISSRQSSRTDINKSQNMIFISNEPLPQQRCEWQDAAGGGVSKSSQSSSDPCQRDTYDRPDDGDSSSPSSRPSSQASPRSDEQEQIIQEGASETSSSRRSSQAASIGERGRNMLDDGPSRSFSTRPSSPDDAGWEEGTFAKAETEELEGRLE